MEQSNVSLADVIVIEGRTFRGSVSTTFEQDIYIMQVLEEAGLSDLASTFDITKDDIGDIQSRVIIKAFSSGKLFDLLAASLEEEGVKWTVHRAKENAKFFANIRKTEDKKNLRGSIVGVVLGFFVSGLLSSKTFQKSSTVSLEPVEPDSGLQLSLDAVVSDSETGTV